MISRQSFSETLRAKLLAAGVSHDNYNESFNVTYQYMRMSASATMYKPDEPNPPRDPLLELHMKIGWDWSARDEIQSSVFSLLEPPGDWQKVIHVSMIANLLKYCSVEIAALEWWRTRLIAEFGEWIPRSEKIGEEYYSGRQPVKLVYASPKDRGPALLSEIRVDSNVLVILRREKLETVLEEAIANPVKQLVAAWEIWCKHGELLLEI